MFLASEVNIENHGEQSFMTVWNQKIFC